MVYVMLHTNRTFTDEFYPFFEIVYAIEIAFILICYALAPITLKMLWNARPFHRNLRLSFCNLVIQGVLGTTARLIFMYNQYAENGPLQERPSVIIASLLRCSMFEAFVGVFFFFAVERLIATVAWSWYEKATLRTLIVFVILESTAMVWAWSWSLALHFEFIKSKHLMIGFACSAVVGTSIGFVCIAINYRAMAKMKQGARVNRYSVAKSFQFRENMIIIKALFKIGLRSMFLNVPVFVLGMCHLFLSGENALTKRMISRAIFDLAISVYPAMIITYLPLSDSIFERSLKRIRGGHFLFNAFSKLHLTGRKRIKEEKVFNETDQYFNMLAMSLNGPPSTK